MPSWSNWSGKLQAQPKQLHFLRSEEDAQALARATTEQGRRLRVAGATHSHSPLVRHDDLIVDASGLTGVIDIDTRAKTAWIAAGTRIYALGKPLHDAGLALSNQGDIDQQAISGATATGTHGTGVSLQNLSSAVVGAQIVLADGEKVECGPNQHEDLWQASRLHLGALGIVTSVKLQLRDAYRLQEKAWTMSLDEALEVFAEEASEHRHNEFFWFPHGDHAQGKYIDLTDLPAEYPLAEEGQRCAWNYEVLPNHRPHKHTEMEYSVPASAGPDCMRAIRNLLNTEFTNVTWPVEYRTLAADDVWLSTAYEQDTVTISVHEDINTDDEAYFRACEEIFLAFSGKPHWGKVNYLSGAQLATCHARWDDWWRVRNDVDPNGTFLNDYLNKLRQVT